MTKVEFTETGSKGVLSLAGLLTSEYACTIKEALLKALNLKDTIEIQFHGVEKADFSFLQLLCAAEKSALQRKKTLNISGPLPDALQKALQDSGFSFHPLLSGVVAP